MLNDATCFKSVYISALNALLNIDEKGSEAADMEESEQETPECLPKQEETPAIVNHTEKPHKPVKKEFLRERMNVFREQAIKGERADKEKTGEIGYCSLPILNPVKSNKIYFFLSVDKICQEGVLRSLYSFLVFFHPFINISKDKIPIR